MANKFITSMTNALVKEIVLLQTKKSIRKKEGLFVVEGLKAINELPNDAEIVHFLVSESVDLDTIVSYKEEPIIVTDEVFKRLSDTETPQGVMAVVKIKETLIENLKPKSNSFYVVLENLQDPGNVGTILRTAYGLGVDAVFMTKGCVDLYNPKTVRATMGALLHLPVIVDIETQEICEWFKENDIPLYVTDLQDAKPISSYKFIDACGIAIGNEGSGISELLRNRSDYKMMIPMPGGLESLNASVAASICIYEVMRQR
ncbi:MAG: TrmH family RNA methyltransferase [Cellulosilyticaceae bacterium]